MNIIKIVILSMFLIMLLTGKTIAIEISDEAAQINVNGIEKEVSFVITDENGKRLGYSPILNKYYRVLEGEFGTFGVGCLNCEDNSPTSYEAMLNLESQVYDIEILGGGLTEYYVSISIIANKESGKSYIKGVTAKGRVSKFKFKYHSDYWDEWAVTRAATPSSLKQDIELSRNINWISNNDVMKSLLSKAENIEKSISKDKKGTAINQLNAFINEVKAQGEKHLHRDASTMLIEDAEYILKKIE